jgi:alcohol dehydrogenase
VDTVTTPMLLKVVQSGRLRPGDLITHRFAMDDVMKAYDTFGHAAAEGALKVILRNGPAVLTTGQTSSLQSA